MLDKRGKGKDIYPTQNVRCLKRFSFLSLCDRYQTRKIITTAIRGVSRQGVNHKNLTFYLHLSIMSLTAPSDAGFVNIFKCFCAISIHRLFLFSFCSFYVYKEGSNIIRLTWSVQGVNIVKGNSQRTFWSGKSGPLVYTGQGRNLWSGVPHKNRVRGC